MENNTENNQMVTIEFKTTKEIKNKLDLSLLVLNMSLDEAFEYFVDLISYKALKKSYYERKRDYSNEKDLLNVSNENFHFIRRNPSSLEEKIEKWAERKEGTYFLIIKSYFLVYKNSNAPIVTSTEMEHVFESLDNRPSLTTISRFLLNFRLLCSDAPRAYGKLFDYNKDTKEVKINSKYKELLFKHMDDFLSE